MDKALDAQVRGRANRRCEYCGLPQKASPLKFQIDHIIAKQHRGADESANLALACVFCNSRKGPNLSGIDPLTGTLTRLFHPRADRWNDHFKQRGPLIEGSSAIGRSTIVVLAMNHSLQLRLRRTMLDEEAKKSQ